VVRKLSGILNPVAGPRVSSVLARFDFRVGLVVCLLLTGCEVVVRDDARDFVEETVAECGGTVTEMVLVSDGLFTNKLTGYARVEIGAEEYTPSLSVTVGVEQSLIEMDSDPCALYPIEESLLRLTEPPRRRSPSSPPQRRVWQDQRMFEPYSRTAQSITGPIKLSGNPQFATRGSEMFLTFGNGNTVKLTSVGAWWKTWSLASDDKVTGEIFQLEHDPGPLNYGNTLCGDPGKNPARFFVFHQDTGASGTELLGVAVFRSEKPPDDINSPGLCGTFNFYAE